MTRHEFTPPKNRSIRSDLTMAALAPGSPIWIPCLVSFLVGAVTVVLASRFLSPAAGAKPAGAPAAKPKPPPKAAAGDKAAADGEESESGSEEESGSESESEESECEVAEDAARPEEWGVDDAPYKMILAVNQSLLDDQGRPTKMKPGKARDRSIDLDRSTRSIRTRIRHAVGRRASSHRARARGNPQHTNKRLSRVPPNRRRSRRSAATPRSARTSVR